MCIKTRFRLSIDYRADLCCDVMRIPDLQLARRACDHFDDPIRNVVLHEQ